MLCDKCRVIIEENLSKISWIVFERLSTKKIKWYCDICKPGIQQKQIDTYYQEIRNFINDQASKVSNKDDIQFIEKCNEILQSADK